MTQLRTHLACRLGPKGEQVMRGLAIIGLLVGIWHTPKMFTAVSTNHSPATPGTPLRWSDVYGMKSGDFKLTCGGEYLDWYLCMDYKSGGGGNDSEKIVKSFTIYRAGWEIHTSDDYNHIAQLVTNYATKLGASTRSVEKITRDIELADTTGKKAILVENSNLKVTIEHPFLWNTARLSFQSMDGAGLQVPEKETFN